MKTIALTFFAIGMLAGLPACTTVVDRHTPTTTSQETHSVSTPVGGVSTTTSSY